MKTDATTGEKPVLNPPPASRPATASAVFAAYWLPVLLWCGLIFAASSDAGSSFRTSRILAPVLRWLIPDISPEAISRVQAVVRKSAHMTEYAVLAVLVWRARRKLVNRVGQPWHWGEALLAFGFAVIFAVSDEIHQSFVPTRDGRAIDVLIDAGGALLGLLALRAWGRWRRRW